MGTLIFSYIRRLGPLFGFKILDFDILGHFQKSEYFWIIMKMRIFCGVITKDKKKYLNFNIFGGFQKNDYIFFFGYCDENEDIFGGRHKR